MKFTKMQGLGNDYVYVNCLKEKIENPSELAVRISDRHFGVGSDGLIMINPSDKADFEMEMYNADGSRGEMCGNGIRCVAKYVYDYGLTDKTSISVETLAGIKYLDLTVEDGKVSLVKVDMGAPILEDAKIPFKGIRKLKALDREFEIFPVSMGNPHCIIFTDENPLELAKTYGPVIEKHEYFPEKTNTEFVKVISGDEVEMRVYERGCGITLACGTGACATVVAAVLNNLTENRVKVNLLGGPVFVEWQGSKDNTQQDIFLIGSASYSFFAEYIL